MSLSYGRNPSNIPVPLTCDAAGVLNVNASVSNAPAMIEKLVAFGAAVSVGVLTPLIALTPLAKAYATLLWAGFNSGTRPVTFIIDVSVDGTHVEPANQQTFIVQPGQALSLEVAGSPSRPYWSLAAQSSDGTPCNVTFAWLGVPK